MTTENTPYALDSLVTVEVNDLARGGAGVGRLSDGRIIFIPFTAPGDRVEARVTEVFKRYLHGEMTRLLHASSIRVEARCPAFTRCGGCQWQHLPYAVQWNTKKEGVKHALTRAGVTAPEHWAEFPAERPWEYRNRVQLRGEQLQLGYFERSTRQLVPVDRCDLARVEINASWESIRTQGQALRREYKVEAVVDHEGRVALHWNSRHGAGGFRQVNDEQNERLRQWIHGALGAGEWLLDLFGGSGNLSELIAPRWKRIDCVDLGSPVGHPASSPENIFFHRMAVVPWLVRESQTTKSPEGAIAAILDPPREGLDRDFPVVAGAFDKLRVTQCVAVGCDPDAWARDLNHFVRRGWTIVKAAVFDFFPQTRHVEAAALLTRPSQRRLQSE